MKPHFFLENGLVTPAGQKWLLSPEGWMWLTLPAGQKWIESAIFDKVKNEPQLDPKTFITLLQSDLTHNKITYRLGLNTNTLDFKPSGLYFTTAEYATDLPEANYGDLIAIITLPEKELIWSCNEPHLGRIKMKARNIIITEIMSIYEFIYRTQNIRNITKI